MTEAPSEIPRSDTGGNFWMPIWFWAGIHFLLWLALFLFLLLVMPQFQKMFEEFGIELGQMAQVTLVSSDQVCRYWPILFPICLLYPCSSFGLMFVARKRKSTFRLVSLGLALIPLALLLLAVFSLLMPFTAIMSGLRG